MDNANKYVVEGFFYVIPFPFFCMRRPVRGGADRIRRRLGAGRRRRMKNIDQVSSGSTEE